MYRATATLVLLIAILGLWTPSAGWPLARTAAQDAPTATIDAPQVAGATATAPPEVAETATTEPTATLEPTATTEPTATATLDLAPTATPTSAATSTPEPIATSVPATEEPVPTAAGSVEATATQASAPAGGTPNAQLEDSADAASEAPPLTLSVAAGKVSFGRVSATGELDPAIAGLSSATDDRGASYVLAGAVAVTVSAGIPWTGACAAAENAGTAATVAVASGRLEWRLAGTTTWTPFSPSASDLGCFLSPEPGTRTFVYDLRLRVDAGDPPGTFRTVLVFTVEP